ncbi:MAG: acyltransferase [Planctomycetaceae bacterium]|nr:acyltransferase [Planctomycetaceae bacterium]
MTSNSSELTPQSRGIVGRHIPALDGVRGLAVLAVVLFHGMAIGRENVVDRVVASIREPLWAGVDLFFVLSGFLITGILLDTRSTAHYFRKFFARRVLRIFPLYYGVLVALFVILPFAGKLFPSIRAIAEGDYFSRLWDHQIWLWTYMQNFLLPHDGDYGLPGLGHFWTLAIEEQFYLFWPFVVFFLRRRALLGTAVAICVAVCIFRPAALANGLLSEWAVRHFTFTRIDSLLYGAIAAIVIRDERFLKRVLSHWRGSVVLLVSVISATAYVAGHLHSEDPLVMTFVYPAFGLLFAIMILLTVVGRDDQVHLRLLNRRWLRMLGKYSYSVYVFHWPICWALRELSNRFSLYPRVLPFESFEGVVITLLTLTVTLPLSFLSWHLYEQPWLSLKKHFPYQQSLRPSDCESSVKTVHSPPRPVTTSVGE